MLAFFIVFKNMYHVLRILFKQQEQQAVMGSVVFLLAIGMFFYHGVESLGYLDALYLSVMTLTTVGYGDLHPVTPLGKIFSMGYVLLGIGMISALIANFNRALRQHHGVDTPPKKESNE
ncbi:MULTISPECIES: potassium channel family protein [Exiguobacterium]|uniref:Ion transporter n=1 Tax=Exiguobacterium acetylicum TaxID=41170 RepID=A0ABX8G661_EXIAC|nr:MULTISPECIES: potassium channel family protein [Exiguobacterium]AOT00756.1 potassium transporter [Exiguobacterium sp. U13-1]QWB28702.1 ion transporter [Exiguobacterium acetylicum]HCD58411.1 two pore domain potassium channel family protein [Exiguobacterium sp.]